MKHTTFLSSKAPFKNIHQEVIYECKWEHQGIIHAIRETSYNISYRRNVHIEKLRVTVNVLSPCRQICQN
jgi:hypothetical protein